jgi:uncharacterized protein
LEPNTLILLCLAAFIAGFIDAIAGGGGLIQVPAALILLPQQPVAQVMGSLKIPAFTGTAFASYQYLQKIKVQMVWLIPMALLAFGASFTGSFILSQVNNQFMKPILVVILTLVAIYTFSKKELGTQIISSPFGNKPGLKSILICVVIGLYDGFIGPGAGSFLLLCFIHFLGMNFMQASTHAKMINLATNLGSIIFFLLKGNILWQIALPMALLNAAGGRLGAKLALKKGNGFIRAFFLLVVCGTLLKLSWDIWKQYFCC